MLPRWLWSVGNGASFCIVLLYVRCQHPLPYVVAFVRERKKKRFPCVSDYSWNSHSDNMQKKKRRKNVAAPLSSRYSRLIAVVTEPIVICTSEYFMPYIDTVAFTCFLAFGWRGRQPGPDTLTCWIESRSGSDC